MRLPLSALALAGLLLPPLAAQQAPLTRIAFGSCAKQGRPQPVWGSIAMTQPELLLLLGDCVYADAEEEPELDAAWAELAAEPGFAALREDVPLLLTWDDHDYGRNDAGAEYPLRDASQRALLDFLGVPADSPRRAREGVYHSETFGPEGQRVQVLLLDTRYARSPMTKADPRPRGLGPYTETADPGARMLSEAQWSWLEARLREPAELRVLCSSIQLVADEHGWEGWYTHPTERARLLQLLADTRAGGVVVLSGDRHAAEISRLDAARDGRGPGYPLYDVTASALNQSRRWRSERNRHRVGDLFGGANFGTLDIDWEAPGTRVRFTIHDEAGVPMLSDEVTLEALQPPPEGAATSPERLDRIAFGSCNQESRPTPIWEDVRSSNPQLFLFLGDNIYGDTTDMDELRAKYQALGAQPGFAALRESVPVLATWDDHDFGRNDSGKEYPRRRESQEILLDFFQEPLDSPRRAREGVYGSWLYGPPTERVQVILLDLRTHKDAWDRREGRPRRADGRPGGYAPSTDPTTTILGEDQWTWLAEQLSIPARLRVIGTSLQCLSEGHAWECWALMPHERERLFATLRTTRANGVILLSGDTHWAELSMLKPRDSGLDYPLWELTSSGLNQAWEYTNIHNPHRVGLPLWEPNFGRLAIDWQGETVRLEARARSGASLGVTLNLESLTEERDR